MNKTIKNVETKNAEIKNTTLGIEDHGIFTFCLHLDYGGSGQGAGQYRLDAPKRDGKREPTHGAQLIREILETVGVYNWEDLPGKHIRVKADNVCVYAIGHITDDKWLCFKDFWEYNQ